MSAAAKTKGCKPGTPYLSRELKFASDRLHCANCGAANESLAPRPDGKIKLDSVKVWIECDDKDQETLVAFPLCRNCSDKIIAKHPRLYRVAQQHEPIPGLMPLCDDCRFHAGGKCAHPEAKQNGGKGVTVMIAPPSRALVNPGGLMLLYLVPAIQCRSKHTEAKPVDLVRAVAPAKGEQATFL